MNPSKKTEPKDTINTKLNQPENDLCEIESAMIALDQSFSRVAAIEDTVTREYELAQEAKQLDIPIESYRRMFESYYNEKNAQKTPTYSWLKPVQFLDKRLGDFVCWCQNVSVYNLATVVGQFTLLAAMGSYFLEAPQRQQQALNDARSEIRNQANIEYSQSRIEAMELLNKYCESILGEQATKANLEGIKLNNCYKFELGLSSFTQWPPQFFRYEGFTMAQMNLAKANLRGANLAGVNLAGANLEGANLNRANLKGANLKGANLKGANLRLVNLEGANLEGANLDGISIERSNLKNANLTESSMIKAWLPWTDLQGAQLSFANLENANLSRANLQEADLYKANLKGTSLRYADLRKGAIIIGANLDKADLKRAKFWSTSELKRAYNWETAMKDEDWEEKIAHPNEDKYKIGYLIPDSSSIYKLYQRGMENALKSGKNIKFLPIETGDTVEQESRGIKQLRDQDVDIILLRPVDLQNSIAAIKEAFASGVVVVTIGDCLPQKAHRFVFACYESDSFQMGYDVAKYMADAGTKKLSGKPLNIGLIDGADSSRVYPYFKGFLAGMQDSKVNWSIVSSTNAQNINEDKEVKELLLNNPKINALWGGSEITTTLAINTVKKLGLEEKIQVFGIVPLTRDLANMLLDPSQPLQSIVDESPTEAGFQTLQHGINVIEGKNSREYQRIVYKHRLLTQNDTTIVNQLLTGSLDIEGNKLQKHQTLIEPTPPKPVPTPKSVIIKNDPKSIKRN